MASCWPNPCRTPGQEPIGTIDVVVKQPLRRQGIRLPDAVPPVTHRAGLDLNPLDPGSPDDAAWLRTLVWPGQDHRLTRLDAALADAVVTDPAQHPSIVTAGDIRDPATIDALLAAAPAASVPVLFHTAVLAYLDEHDRASTEAALRERSRTGACHWVSNEGRQVLPGVASRVAEDDAFTADLRRGSFVVALDGEPLYQAAGHAGWILG